MRYPMALISSWSHWECGLSLSECCGTPLSHYPNYEVFPCRFHDLLCHLGQGVDLHEPRNLCQQAMQETEVPTSDPDDSRQGFCIRHAVHRQCHVRSGVAWKARGMRRANTATSTL